MKILALLLSLAVAGYWVYGQWFAAPQPPPPASVAAPARTEPVNFAVRSRVRKLFEEWKRQELRSSSGQHSLAVAKPSEEIKQIRQYLFREGRYSEGAVHDVIVRALREMGVAESEIHEAAGGMMSLGN